MNAPITRVVRAEASGTTASLKAYLGEVNNAPLACTEGGKGWKQLAAEGQNTVWPEALVGGCTATGVSGIVTAKGGAAEVNVVNQTEGSIGYAALPDVEAHKSGSTHWISLQNNGVSNKLAIAQMVSPLEEVGDSAACTSSVYGVAKGGKSSLANVADADWSSVTGGDPHIAGDSSNPNAYPLCTLTYDVALTHYGKAGFTQGQALTTAAYLDGIVTAEEGQEALEAGAYYAPLPQTGSPASDVLDAARLAASEIGF